MGCVIGCIEWKNISQSIIIYDLINYFFLWNSQYSKNKITDISRSNLDVSTTMMP